MHFRSTLTAALAVSFGLVGAASAATTAPAKAATPAAAKPAGGGDHAQIEALEKGFAAAFNAKDVKAIMSYYARQGLFVFDVTPPRQHVGWDDYRKDWQSFFTVVPGKITFRLSDLDITVVGPVAYSHSIQDMRYAAGKGMTEVTVRVTDVYRKAAGKWLIVQEHVSVPVDVDTGKADLLSKP